MTHGGLTPTVLWLMLLLGAYHGVNPGMGWLFAVALGMQEQKGSAVARSLAGMVATGVHTVAYLAVTGLVASVVYRKLGLALLRKAWLNFDLVWAAALMATGLVTLLI